MTHVLNLASSDTIFDFCDASCIEIVTIFEAFTDFDEINSKARFVQDNVRVKFEDVSRTFKIKYQEIQALKKA